MPTNFQAKLNILLDKHATKNPLSGLIRDHALAQALIKPHPRLSAKDFFKDLDEDQKQLFKYYLLQLALRFPEHFKKIEPNCLYLRLLQTQRTWLDQSPQTKSMKDFEWLQKQAPTPKGLSTLNALNHIEPFFTNEIYDDAKQNPIHTFKQTLGHLLTQNEHGAVFRCCQFLIYYYDINRLKDYPHCNEIISAAHHQLGIYYATLFENDTEETAHLRQATTHLTASVYMRTLSTDNPAKATIKHLLQQKITKNVMSKLPDGLNLFYHLYYRLPFAERLTILLSYLANPSDFSPSLPSVFFYQTLLTFSKKKLSAIDCNKIHPLIALCIQLKLDDSAETKENVEKKLVMMQTTDPIARTVLTLFYLSQNQLKEALPRLTWPDGTSTFATIKAFHRAHDAYFKESRERDALNTLYGGKVLSSDEQDKITIHQQNMEKHREEAITIAQGIDINPCFPSLDLCDVVNGLIQLRENTIATRCLNQYRLHHPNEINPDLETTTGTLIGFSSRSEKAFFKARPYFLKALKVKPGCAQTLYELGYLASLRNISTTKAWAYTQLVERASEHWYPTEKISHHLSSYYLIAFFDLKPKAIKILYPDEATQKKAMRGMLTHFHTQVKHYTNPLVKKEIIRLIREFFDETYDKQFHQSLLQDWPQDYRVKRFEILLTLADTLKKWRCYKPLFLDRHFIENISAEALFNIVQGFASNDHLRKRALTLYQDKHLDFSKKLEELDSAIQALAKPTLLLVGSLTIFKPSTNDTSESDSNALSLDFRNFRK